MKNSDFLTYFPISLLMESSIFFTRLCSKWTEKLFVDKISEPGEDNYTLTINDFVYSTLIFLKYDTQLEQDLIDMTIFEP